LRERTGEPLGKIPFRRTPDFDEIQVFLRERQRPDVVDYLCAASLDRFTISCIA
jgi:hypothetical protein